MNHKKALITITGTTVVFCLAYLLYAAWRGWVGLDTITLLVTILNSALLVLVLKKFPLLERDD